MSIKDLVDDAQKTHAVLHSVIVSTGTTPIAAENRRRVSITFVPIATAIQWTMGTLATGANVIPFVSGVPITFNVRDHGSLPQQAFSALTSFGNLLLNVIEVVLKDEQQ